MIGRLVLAALGCSVLLSAERGTAGYGETATCFEATADPPPALATSAHSGGPELVTVPDLPVGPPPRVPYLTGLTVRCPNGYDVKLEEPSMWGFGAVGGEPIGRGIAGFAPYGNGWIVLNPQFEYALLGLRRPDGSVSNNDVSELSGEADWNYVFRADPGSGRVLYQRTEPWPPRMVAVHPATGSETVWAPGVTRKDIVPVGFVGRGAVVFKDDEYGNRVFLGRRDGSLGAMTGLVDAWGTSKSRHWVSGTTYAADTHDEDGFVSGVFHAFTGDPLWTTPHLEATLFSPDSEHVLGVDYAWEPYELAVMDSATGQRLAHVELVGDDGRRRLFVWDTYWEDDDHVLAVIEYRRTWSLLRLGVDGSVELALPWERSDSPDLYLPNG